MQALAQQVPRAMFMAANIYAAGRLRRHVCVTFAVAKNPTNSVLKAATGCPQQEARLAKLQRQYSRVVQPAPARHGRSIEGVPCSLLKHLATGSPASSNSGSAGSVPLTPMTIAMYLLSKIAHRLVCGGADVLQPRKKAFGNC